MFIIYRRENLFWRIVKFRKSDAEALAAQALKLWKPFAVSFAVLFVCVNWQNISWLFNYKVAAQYLSDLGPQKELPAQAASIEVAEDQLFAASGFKDSPGDEAADQPENGKAGAAAPAKPKTAAAPVLTNKITISKIGITAPIVVSDTADNTIIHKYLDKGVVMYPGSAVPGSAGETMLLGHSAPPGWPNIKYDWVFTKINLLVPGDVVSLTFGGQVKNYSVIKTVFLERGQELPTVDLSQNTLFLISCWPPGKDLKRIAVEAVLQDGN